MFVYKASMIVGFKSIQCSLWLPDCFFYYLPSFNWLIIPFLLFILPVLVTELESSWSLLSKISIWGIDISTLHTLSEINQIYKTVEAKENSSSTGTGMILLRHMEKKSTWEDNIAKIQIVWKPKALWLPPQSPPVLQNIIQITYMNLGTHNLKEQTKTSSNNPKFFLTPAGKKRFFSFCLLFLLSNHSSPSHLFSWTPSSLQPSDHPHLPTGKYYHEPTMCDILNWGRPSPYPLHWGWTWQLTRGNRRHKHFTEL